MDIHKGAIPDLTRNERMVLALIRRRGPMARAGLAQAIGLSAQAVTNLTRKLMTQGYLDAGAVVRGKVGQPSTPLGLRADAALFLGLKIGRRLVELALVDFAGTIRLHRQEIHAHPDPDHILSFSKNGITTFLNDLPADMRGRIAGLGVATPFRLWDWGDEMTPWRGRDLQTELGRDLPFPVFLENDASSACMAQLVFGRTPLPPDFLHLYIAHFAGGGLVIDGNLRIGAQRNAASLGSMPLPQGRQLLEVASVSALERRIGRALPPDDSGWSLPPDQLAEWLTDAGAALAFAALSAVALLDLPVVVIDGAVPADIRTALIAATDDALAAMPAAGIDRPRLIAGDLGRSARILGAAALPLTHFFQPDGMLEGAGHAPPTAITPAA